MPGSCARRKRDNSIWSRRGESDFLPDPARWDEDVDVVFRVEQDHCLGADRDDRRDGRRDPVEHAGRSQTSWKSRSTSWPGRRRPAPAAAGAGRRSSSRSRRCWPRPTPSTARRTPRSAKCAIPSTRASQQDRPQSVRMSSARRSPRSRRLRVLRRRWQATRARSGILTSSMSGSTSRRHFAKGTKMTFAGLPKAQDRADVIAYLQELEVATDESRSRRCLKSTPISRSLPTWPMPPARRSAPISATPLAVDDKADLTPVTAADRAAEAAMRQLIERAFPTTASSARNSAASATMPSSSGCSTRSTAPNPSSAACRCSAR